MTNRIMQKEIVSDPFTALVPNTDITDTYKNLWRCNNFMMRELKK